MFRITVEKSDGKIKDYQEAAKLGHTGTRRWLRNTMEIHTEKDIYIEKDEDYTGEERSHTEEEGGDMTPPMKFVPLEQ